MLPTKTLPLYIINGYKKILYIIKQFLPTHRLIKCQGYLATSPNLNSWKDTSKEENLSSWLAAQNPGKQQTGLLKVTIKTKQKVLNAKLKF